MTKCVVYRAMSYIFFFIDPATTEIYTLSLHDALPISAGRPCRDAARLSQLLLRRRAQGLRRCRALHAPHPAARGARLRRRRVRPRRTLPGSAVRGPLGGIALPALGLRGPGAAGREIPLSRGLHAAPRTPAPAAPPLHPGRRLEHRAPRHRSEELEVEPEELRVPARGARLDGPFVQPGRGRGPAPRGAPRAGAVFVVVGPRAGGPPQHRPGPRPP